MMSRTLVTIFFSAFLLSAASALAGSNDGPKTISWDEFKDRCANPTKYPDVQVQPANIRYECTSTQTLWVAEEPGTIPMSGDQQITGAVVSSKFTVAAESSDTQVAGQTGSCPRYKEVSRVIGMEVQVSCDDILGGKGGGKTGDMSPGAFCAAQLGGQGAGKTVQQTDTGREISTCAGVAGAVIPGGGK